MAVVADVVDHLSVSGAADVHAAETAAVVVVDVPAWCSLCRRFCTTFVIA